MDSSFGRALAERAARAIAAIMVVAFIAGVAAAFLLPWFFNHIYFGWH